MKIIKNSKTKQNSNEIIMFIILDNGKKTKSECLKYSIRYNSKLKSEKGGLFINNKLRIYYLYTAIVYNTDFFRGEKYFSTVKVLNIKPLSLKFIRSEPNLSLKTVVRELENNCEKNLVNRFLDDVKRGRKYSTSYLNIFKSFSQYILVVSIFDIVKYVNDLGYMINIYDLIKEENSEDLERVNKIIINKELVKDDFLSLKKYILEKSYKELSSESLNETLQKKFNDSLLNQELLKKFLDLIQKKKFCNLDTVYNILDSVFFGISNVEFNYVLNFTNKCEDIVILKDGKCINNEKKIKYACVKEREGNNENTNYFVYTKNHFINASKISNFFQNVKNKTVNIDFTNNVDISPLTAKQKEIFFSVLENSLVKIQGCGGSGKTYLMKKIAEFFAIYGLKVVILSNNFGTIYNIKNQFENFEGDDIKNDKYSKKIKVLTLAKAFTKWSHDTKFKKESTESDVLMFDETQNMDVENFSICSIFKNVKKFVCFGDFLQLRHVGFGAPYTEINDLFKCFEIDKNLRISKGVVSSEIKKISTILKEMRNIGILIENNEISLNDNKCTSPMVENILNLLSIDECMRYDLLIDEIKNLLITNVENVFNMCLITFTHDVCGEINNSLKFLPSKICESMKWSKNSPHKIYNPGQPITIKKNTKKKVLKIGSKKYTHDETYNGEFKWIKSVEEIGNIFLIKTYPDEKTLLLGLAISEDHVEIGLSRTIDSSLGQGFKYCYIYIGSNDFLMMGLKRFYTACSRTKEVLKIFGEKAFTNRKKMEHVLKRKKEWSNLKLGWKNFFSIKEQILFILNDHKKDPQTGIKEIMNF